MAECEGDRATVRIWAGRMESEGLMNDDCRILGLMIVGFEDCRIDDCRIEGLMNGENILFINQQSKIINSNGIE